MSLTDLANKHGSDKGSYHSYPPTYEELFGSRQNEEIYILEIGVLHGGSLRMWQEYFPNGQVFGIEDFSQAIGFGVPVDGDAVEAALKQEPRITLFRVDVMDIPAVTEKIGGRTFDFVVDDGCHSQEQQMSNLVNFLPLVRSGGIYCCEDVQHNTPKTVLEDIAKPQGEVSWYEGGKTSDDRILIVRKP